jgi:hypothetical protein
LKNLKFVLISIILGIILGSSIYFVTSKVDSSLEHNCSDSNITDCNCSDNEECRDINNTIFPPPIPLDYNSTPPTKDGKIKAVVVIGSSGFDGFIIKIDKDKNWESKKAYWGKETEIWEGDANSEKIMKGFKKFLRKIAKDGKEFGAKNLDRKVSLIVSSGASKANEAVSKIISVLKKHKWNTIKIKANEEAKYGFLVAVPKIYINNSFLVDIGSGNTKIAYMEDNKLKTLEGHGSKAYKAGKSLDDVYDNIKTLLEDIPDISRERAFMIGGVPYKLAKGIKKEGEKYTSLLQPSEYKVTDFKPKNKEKMEYGLKIYQGIKDATETEQYIFPWDSNFGIGFLINQKY